MNYYVIKEAPNENYSDFVRICQTLEEAESHIMEYADAYCGKGSCTIQKITDTFKVLEERTYRDGNLIYVEDKTKPIADRLADFMQKSKLKEEISDLDKAAIGTVMTALADANNQENTEITAEQKVIENAYTEVLRRLVQGQFNSISDIESAIATFVGGSDDLNAETIESIMNVLNEIVSSTYVNIGMLQKAMAEIADTSTASMQAGEAVASQLIDLSED